MKSRIVLVACGFALGGTLLAAEPGPRAEEAGASASEPAAPKVVLREGDVAPAFLLKTLDEAACGEKIVASKKLFGSRVEHPRAVVLSFAASYCKPCRAELPHLKALADRFAGRPVQFVVVVRDEDDAGIETMRKLAIEELGVRFPVLSDRFSLVSRRYGAEELPFLVVIGADGRVAWVQSGFHDETLPRLEQVLGRVLPPETASGSNPPPGGALVP